MHWLEKLTVSLMPLASAELLTRIVHAAMEGEALRGPPSSDRQKTMDNGSDINWQKISIR